MQSDPRHPAAHPLYYIMLIKSTVNIQLYGGPTFFFLFGKGATHILIFFKPDFIPHPSAGVFFLFFSLLRSLFFFFVLQGFSFFLSHIFWLLLTHQDFKMLVCSQSYYCYLSTRERYPLIAPIVERPLSVWLTFVVPYIFGIRYICETLPCRSV